ncbi:MAG: hypothetical protein KDA62_17430, partial [Planctomycetales bacterium]|nr:hypothetical protein [Planctomycetales bacterium]
IRLPRLACHYSERKNNNVPPTGTQEKSAAKRLLVKGEATRRSTEERPDVAQRVATPLPMSSRA